MYAIIGRCSTEFVCMLNFARKCLGENNIMMKLCIRIFDGAFIQGYHGENRYGNICFSCIMFSINFSVYNAHMPGSKLYCN